ncbi:MAG: hypothetical protein ACR2GY_07520 [Phycisphaerales bacterium]
MPTDFYNLFALFAAATGVLTMLRVTALAASAMAERASIEKQAAALRAAYEAEQARKKNKSGATKSAA